MLIPPGLGEGAGEVSVEFVIVQKLTWHEAEWSSWDYWTENLTGVEPLTYIGRSELDFGLEHSCLESLARTRWN